LRVSIFAKINKNPYSSATQEAVFMCNLDNNSLTALMNGTLFPERSRSNPKNVTYEGA
jgi:hypothetical protein